jgi:hypothetical protein
VNLPLDVEVGKRPRPRPVTRATSQRCMEDIFGDSLKEECPVPTTRKPAPFPLAFVSGSRAQPQTPMSSPVRVTATKASGSFPDLSPLANDHHSVTPKLRKTRPVSQCRDTDAKSDDEDELSMKPNDEVQTEGGLRPFPMATDMLRSIGNITYSPPDHEEASSSKLSGGKIKKRPATTSRKLKRFPMPRKMLESIAPNLSPQRTM